MTELIAAPAGQPRLQLLIKAKIAHQAGFYLLNGRWHSIHQNKPAPKGAPVAAHPKAAGVHAPVKHFSEDEWSQLKLPSSNTNAATFNAQLDKLKQYSEAGDVTGILGMQLGTNTYGKKLSMIANNLLGLHGTEHKVAPGQKAGEHHAVKHVPDAAPAAKEPVVEAAKVIEAAKPEPEPEPVIEYLTPAKADEPEPEAPAFSAYPSTGPLAMPAFVEGKTTTGVVAYYQKQAMKVIDAAESGDAEELAQMKAVGLKPNGKGKISNTWAGKTQNSKLLLKLHANATESVGGAAPAPAPAAEPAEPKTNYLEKIENASSLSAAEMFANLHHAQNGYSEDSKAEANLAKLTAVNKLKQAPAPAATPAPVATASDMLAQIPWDKLSSPEAKGDGSPNKEGINANKKLAAIKAAAEAGDVAALEGMKFGVNTYGKKLNQAKAISLAALEGATAAATAPAEPVPEPVTAPVTHTLAMQLADAKGPMGKMAVAEQHVVKHGKSAATYKEIAEAHEDLGNADSAAHWHSKASDIEAFDKLSDDIKSAGSTTAATKVAVQHVIKAKHSAKAVEQAVEALKAHGYDGAAIAIQSAYDETIKPVPVKPDMFPSLHWQDVADSIESAISSGDIAKLQQHIDTSEGLTSEPAKIINAYAKAGLASLDAGPKDGDTKPGANGGTLVFKDGHWHKQDEPSAGLTAEQKQLVMGYLNSSETTEDQYQAGKDIFKKLPEEQKLALNAEAMAAKKADPSPAAEIHPIDAVPMPDLSGFMSGTKLKVEAALQKLKDQAKVDGASAFTGVLKKMSKSGKLITKLPGEYGSFKVTGYEHNPNSAHAKVHQYVEELKAAAGGKKASKPKPKAAPSGGMVSIDPLAQSQGQGPIPSMDGWKQIGPQGGSNPGGKFVDQDGVEWYCKFPKDDDIAKSEVLASKLYGAAGVAGQDAKLVTKDGKLGIASKWTDVTAASAAQLAKADGAAAGFAVDAWLGNWDVVGLEYDNLQLDSAGKAVRVDAGGSLEYRAQGGKKTFGDNVLEIDSLRDAAINPQSAKVFGKLTEADITASVAKVLSVSNSQIYALVNAYGPGTSADKKKLAETLIARKADLLAKYPRAKKKKVIVFKPENISAPPNFLNWGGGGSSGPSSKSFLNEANEKAVQEIYATAKTGSMEAVNALKADTFNKDTGEVTGSVPVRKHPSQHVKGYAQQVFNEIHQQLNPPKVFRFDGGHPLHALHYAYPTHKGALHGSAVQKIGEFVVLGKADPINLESLALPKVTYASGQLTQGTYSPTAQAAIKLMPTTQKQAVKAYTGQDYTEMNQSLWKGNPTGAAKSAAEALHTLAHDVAPGTVLSRKLRLKGAALDQILDSAGKVLQEPAIMSTSIRPSSWHGNVHLKLHVGPGVKGLWVGYGSLPDGGALSKNAPEDELILPPNTRLLILSVKPSNGGDADGFGNGPNHIIEAVILPTEQMGHA